jgi:nitroreductase
MNETLKVIKSRRSIRKYKAEQIADSELQQILESAIYAPNAMNQQKWHFSVIQDKEVIDRMVDIIKENIMNSDIEFLKGRASTPDYHTFHHAPTVVMVSGEENTKFIQIDCGLAAENMALAAASLDIGSCVITSPDLLFMSEKGNAMKKELGFPDGYQYICTVTLGYRDCENPDAPPRNKEVISYIK